MKKFLLCMLTLLMSVSGAWADNLPASTWGIYSDDLTQYGWTAMGENTPSGVTSLGNNYTPYYRTQEVTLESAASLEVRFKYTAGNHRLDILGVDVLDGNSNVVASDYHCGYTGGQMDKNTYLLNAIGAGTYTLRYIINYGLSNSEGNITINAIKYADSFANISQWYVVRVHANQAHYMYYDTNNSETKISFTSSTADINSNNYLWGFVKNGSGVSIYNKAAGNSLAVDNSTPSKMSSDGTSASFTLGTVAAGTYGWGADAFFSVYKDAGSYLNFQSDKLKRWSAADEGSNFMIYAVDASQDLSYSLTDTNGATYTGSYTGFAGVTSPTFTGCDGYTLSSESWSGTAYSATINFPFAISSNNATNWTYIGSFHNKNNYSSEDYLWQAKDGSPVRVYSGEAPNNTKSNEDVYTENERYKWTFYPALSNGNFTFKIKNSSTGKFIQSPSTNNNTAVDFVEEASASVFTYVAAGSTGTCSNIHALKADNNMYLSVNSVNSASNATNQKLLVYNSVHDGISVGFHTPADFATLDANLIAARTAFMPYSNIIGSGLGQYSGATSSDMSSAYTTATTATTLTAAQLTSLTSTLENPASKLSINLPSAGQFLRIKGGKSGNYVTYGSSGGKYSMGTDVAKSIFYYDGSHLLSYSNGIYWGVSCTSWDWTEVGGTGGTYTFPESNTIGKYFVSMPLGTETRYDYCLLYDGTSNCDRGATNNLSGITVSNYTWSLEEVTSLPVTISGARFASLYSPVALTIPSGVTAYVGTSNTNSIDLTPIDGGIIPANTGVVLEGDAGTYDFAVTTGGSASSDLQGTVAAIATPSTGTTFVLGVGASNGKVGFYKYTGSTLGGFKAYLNEVTTSNQFLFNFVDDDPTAVNSAINGQNLNGQYYDLQGRRVVAPQKGQLYIHNGKKVLY